ncbi:MAG: divergent PAP2 family protein [Oscillospiraceae bacterium]
MEFITQIFSNYVLCVSLISWFMAQVLKTVLTLILLKKFVPERLVGAGGMPSAHSALVCSLTVAVSRLDGINSVSFAICFILAGVVMYDAMGVRRAAGEQAKAINEMRKNDNLSPEEKELKEFLGHTPLEVLGGALLGILIALLIPKF